MAKTNHNALATELIMSSARRNGQRNGAVLLNYLPTEAATLVENSSFNPFYKAMNDQDIESWLSKHVVWTARGLVSKVLDNNGDVIWKRGK